MTKTTAKPLTLYIRNEETKKLLSLLAIAYPDMKSEEIVSIAVSKMWGEVADKVTAEVLALSPK